MNLNLNTKNNDLLFYIISHERSGTHFMINTILKNTDIRQGWHNIGEWYGPYNDHTDRFEHIDTFNRTWEQACKQAAIIKSHCDRDLFNERYKKARVIYLFRDPRDTLVSWFNYMNLAASYCNNNSKVSDHSCRSCCKFLRRQISPFLKYSYSLYGNFSNAAERWVSHVRGWFMTDDSVLVIRYEELHRDYMSVLVKVADFIGLRLKSRTGPVGLHDAPSVFPRKGIIGDWRNYFTQTDELFLRHTVERGGIKWDSVIDNLASSGKFVG